VFASHIRPMFMFGEFIPIVVNDFSLTHVFLLLNAWLIFTRLFPFEILPFC
jgi:hypothetical protein